MAKITCKTDCGNAPKKRFIKDFCTAIAHGKPETIMRMMTDDIHLNVPGHMSINGKKEVEKHIRKEALRRKITELILENILSHGKYCAANGIQKFADGGRVAFCNMYTFSSHSKTALLSEISIYSILLNK